MEPAVIWQALQNAAYDCSGACLLQQFHLLPEPFCQRVTPQPAPTQGWRYWQSTAKQEGKLLQCQALTTCSQQPSSFAVGAVNAMLCHVWGFVYGLDIRCMADECEL